MKVELIVRIFEDNSLRSSFKNIVPEEIGQLSINDIIESGDYSVVVQGKRYNLESDTLYIEAK